MEAMMPTPNENESQQDFVARCIPIVIEDGAAEDAQQAIAVCYAMWEQAKQNDEQISKDEAAYTSRAPEGEGLCRDCVHYRAQRCEIVAGPIVGGGHCDNWEAAQKDGEIMMEYKTLDFKITALDFDGRTVEGYAAVFGNVDLGGDVIHRGAFAKTLAERGNRVKFLWQHNVGEPIGRPLTLQEDERGLFIKAIISDTARGRDALALLRDGAIAGLSIGYDAVKGATDYSNEGDETVRNLREIKLYEFSLVTFPMNESATVTALKTLDGGPEELKFTGSPRNPYGTHASRGYPGGRSAWLNAWRIHMSRQQQGPIQGTIRRVAMIAAAMKPVCKLPEMSIEDTRPREGACGRLAGSYRETPGDYNLSHWKKPGDDGLEQEDIQLTCQDLEDIKRTCIREIAKRHACEDEKATVGGDETKIGRAISKANEERIMSAIDAIDGALDSLRAMIAQAIGSDSPPPEAEAGENEDKAGAGPSQTPTLDMELERQRRLQRIRLYQAMED